VKPPVVQGKCGACWAFAASEVLSDRLCIHSNGEINVILSPQDMVGCDFYNLGCYGGYLINSIEYLEAEGVVTDECVPY
jgi:cathepsin B